MQTKSGCNQICTNCQVDLSNPGKSWCHLDPRSKRLRLDQFINEVKQIKTDIKLGKYSDNPRKRIPSALRHESWKRYISDTHLKGVCFCCRSREIEIGDFECSYVVSKKNGGQPILENVRPICSRCNRSMGTRDMDDFIISCGFWNEPYNTNKLISETDHYLDEMSKIIREISPSQLVLEDVLLQEAIRASVQTTDREIKKKEEYLKYTFNQLQVICALFDIGFISSRKTKISLVEMLLEANITLEEIQQKISETEKYKFRIKCGNAGHIKKLKCGCKIGHNLENGINDMKVNSSSRCSKNHYYFTNDKLFEVTDNTLFYGNSGHSIKNQHCKVCSTVCEAEGYINIFYKETSRSEIMKKEVSHINLILQPTTVIVLPSLPFIDQTRPSISQVQPIGLGIKEKEQYLYDKYTLKQLQTICVLFNIYFTTSSRTKMNLIELILKEGITVEEIQRKISGSKNYKFIIKCANGDHIKKLKCGCKIDKKDNYKFMTFFGCAKDHHHYYFTNDILFDCNPEYSVAGRYCISRHQCKICNDICTAIGYINIFNSD